MRQRFALLCFLFALFAHVTAIALHRHDFAAANATAAANLLSPGAGATHEVASYLETMRQTLTQDDFLAVPFDLSDAKDKAVFAALTRNAAGFQAWRENTARAAYHMELNDYEALFEKHRSSLLDLASSLSIPAETHTVSYQALLRKVDAAVSQRERRSAKGAASSFVEARVAVAVLHTNAHLFRARTTLHALVVQDAIVYGMGDDIAKAIDWVITNVAKYKCTWCKAVVGQIRKALCKEVGKAVCTMLVGLMTGPLGVVGGKFFCGLPLYMSSIFAGWCDKGVAWLQGKAKLSDDCVCGFSVPSFVIPATEFKLLGAQIFKSNRREVALGQVCPTKAGQCLGSF